MWDLQRVVLIKKARNALKDGRLDEAFDIASDKKLRDHRQCQVLLEKLVDPLLDRARRHLEAGRLEDALADVQRAHEAGGNRPETADLREEVLGTIQARRRERRARREAAVSVQRHLDAGRIQIGRARLEAAPLPSDRAEELQRRLDRKRDAAVSACDRARDHLERGEIEAAVGAFEELLTSAREDPASQELLKEIGQRADREIRRALDEGRVQRAESLLRTVATVGAPGLDEPLWREALDLFEKAAAALAREEWSSLRVYLRRLGKLVPEASWVEAAEGQVERAEDALRDLQAGPLGARVSALGRRLDAVELDAQTIALAPPRGRANTVKQERVERDAVRAAAEPTRRQASPSSKRHLLWVEGVGTFLLLASERITIGRAGSSANPDVALAADIEGIHAEILRVDHDYFLVPHGPTFVGGERIERHLLSSGDEIRLGRRCRLTFRQPSKLSPTAVVELGPGLRLGGDVRTLVLLDGPLVFGGSNAHIDRRDGDGRVVLCPMKDGFVCRADEAIVVDGDVRTEEEAVPLDAHVEAGSLTFTLTAQAPDAGRSPK